MAADAPFYLGGDVSALPDLEKFGAIYRSQHQPADALTVLSAHGMNLFRLRLFVNPKHTFDQNEGDTQSLKMILPLATRVKKTGAKLSLALHYSDTWADPSQQAVPAEWKNLSLDRLEKRVGEYTTAVLQAMHANGTDPDIVEIGNETTNGMLWPLGHLGGETDEQKRQKWADYIRLTRAGVAAVRHQLPTARVLIHINSGGKKGFPKWFFDQVREQQLDFDIIGLSFYPIWNDDITSLKTNLEQLLPFKKDVLIIETAYPYQPVKKTPQTTWDMTPAGQKQFLKDLIATVKQAPEHRGIGVVWWYPEAIPIKGHKVWNKGRLGLFDMDGNLLPALDELKLEN